MKTADLHIHSYYSDGTMTIEEIAQEALQRGVGLIAVSDHDMLDGSRELMKLTREDPQYASLTCIPAVEINTLDDEVNVHILGYHVDLSDAAFDAFIRRNRRMLDDVSIRLIRKMEKDYQTISLREFRNYSYDRTMGGFEALHYLKEKGLTQTAKEGFRFFELYDCPYSCVDFPDVRQAAEQVHRAGGMAVLAHPGVTIKNHDEEWFYKELLRYVEMGIDGIECYYPLHPAWMVQMCEELCRRRGLIVTAGSDCHGSFGTARIGEMGIPVSAVTL